MLELVRCGDTAPPHQQPVGVDAVGRAGHQGDVVLALRHLQAVGLGGQDDGDVVHLVGEGPVQHRDGEGVAHLQLIQIGEQLGTGQAPVGRNDRVGAGTAHRQAGAFQMTGGHLQHGIAGAVVDGLLHADLFNGDVAHDAGAGHVQRALVRREPVREIQGVRVCGDLRIEGIGRFKIGGVIRIRQLIHIGGIVGHSTGLVQLVDVVADGGV